MSPQDKMVRKPFNPDRRCHWFDSNGRPYKRLDGGLGCPRSKVCYFAHPTDGEYWRNARPSGEPPLQHLTDDEYRLIVGRPRSPGRTGPPSHHGYHTHHQQHIASGARHRSISPGRKPERSPVAGSSASVARRRTDSRERAGPAASPPLAQRLRGRRSISREREYAAAAAVRVYGRSSRSRSPVPRGRARTPPSASAPRAMRAYGSIPDGPRNGNHTRSPMFPKMEAVDVTMKDVGSVSAAVGVPYGSGRDESIASTRVSSRQPASRVPAPASVSAASTNSVAPPPPQATVSATTASTRTALLQASSSVPNPDAFKSLLESSKLQWQQISTAVAAVTSAVPKASAQSVAGAELSAEEKHKIWTSRIELLAAATRIHNDCRSMENDIRDYKQLVESFSYQTLPVEDRTVIEGHLHTLQGQLAQKTGEMKKIINNLSAAKYWSTYTNKHAPPAELGDNAVNGQEHKQEFAARTGALKGSVSQLQLLFKTVEARWENVFNQLQHNSGSGGGNGNGNGETASSPASTFLVEAIVPAELGKIRDTLANFEDRLGGLERGMQQDQSLLEQLDAIVAENVQAVVLASTGTVQAKAPEPRVAALTDEQLRTLQTLQQNAALTGQHVARLSQEVAQLAGYNERLQTENMMLQAENVQLRQQLEELRNAQPSSSGDTTQADRMISEMRALNAAVRAYISQSSSSAHQPAEPTGDAVVKQLAPYLVKSIPELIAPQLQGLQDTLRATQTQAIQELSTKMTTTLQTVEAIRDLVAPGDGHAKSPSASSTQSSHHEGMNRVS
ncbi:hypothetical protein V8D89_015958 [Ganoderma adspersum]